MADNNSELDAINHLLEIERDAAILIDDAKVEADKRVANAKNQYNEKYKAQYNKIVKELDSDYDKNIEAISNKYNKEINEYKVLLEEKDQDKKGFSAVLDKLLFE